MFDIYRTAPLNGTLQYTLVAGRYTRWEDIQTALHLLESISNTEVFTVTVCKHRKSSSHFKTTLSHTGPTNLTDLQSLLQTLLRTPK